MQIHGNTTRPAYQGGAALLNLITLSVFVIAKLVLMYAELMPPLKTARAEILYQGVIVKKVIVKNKMARRRGSLRRTILVG